jgi:uncharacterized RDD family membrane protein YckC
VDSTPARNAPTTPQPGTDAEDALATRGARWWAAILDTVLLSAVVLVATKLLRGSSCDEGLSWSARQGLRSLACMPLLAYQWWLIARTGQTLGKRWTNIRIVKLDGSPVDFVSGVLLRTALFDAVILLLISFGPRDVSSVFQLLDIVFIFGATQRCLHDRLAGTKVVVAS